MPRATCAPGCRRGPRQRVRAVADRQRHQLVPRRMELDLVDAVAEAVVAPELGQVAVGVARQLARRCALATVAPASAQQPVRPSDLLAPGDLDQQAVAGEGVVADERRRLVHHLVRGVAIGGSDGRRANRFDGVIRPPQRRRWRAGRIA